jgi:hypothetical protein
LAAAEAEAALRMDPGLRAARLNRPYARFLEVYMRDPSGRPVADPGLVTDIRIALGAGPKTQELYYKAAQIVLTFGGGTEETRAEAVRYLAEAVPLGRNPKPLAKDPLLTAHLMGRADFARLVNLPVPEPVQPLSGSPSDPHLAQPAELAAEAPQ